MELPGSPREQPGECPQQANEDPLDPRVGGGCVSSARLGGSPDGASPPGLDSSPATPHPSARHVCRVWSVPPQLHLPRASLPSRLCARARPRAELTPSAFPPSSSSSTRSTHPTPPRAFAALCLPRHRCCWPRARATATDSARVARRLLLHHPRRPGSVSFPPLSPPPPPPRNKALTRCGHPGPAMVLTVPEARKRFFGYRPVERPPTTYPREWSPSLASGQSSCTHSRH